MHSDYHYCKNGQYLCTILDDASRKVLAAAEFDNKTTKNVTATLKSAFKECKPYHPILAIVTDHGSEFYANKRDAKGYAEHEFEQILDRHNKAYFVWGESSANEWEDREVA